LRRLFPQKYPGKERDFAEPIEVESIIGAFMAVRKKTIDKVGMLDELYFFFFEETDWCIRMKKRLEGGSPSGCKGLSSAGSNSKKNQI